MNENKHTPEPWAIDQDDRPNMHWNNHIVSEANPNITICFMAHDGTELNECGEANARRVVACVNACEGIPTDALERSKSLDEFIRSMKVIEQQRDSFNDAAEYNKRRAEDAEKQRDELMTELKKLTEVLANIDITGGLYDDEQDALKSACAAIASVKELK